MTRARAVAVWLPVAALALLISWPIVHGVRAAGADTQLVVADLRADELILIHADGEVTDRLELPGGAHELLFLPDGRVAVSIEQRGLLALVDLDSGGVSEVPVGGTPHGLALDGDVLLVTDRATSQIRRFEIDGWDELEPLPTGDWPHAVALTEDGRVVVAAARSDALLIGDESLGVSALPETVDIAPDGAIATAGAIGGELQLFDTSGAELMRVDLGGRPVRVRFSPDGEQIAVALSATGEVALVDRDGNVQRTSIPGVPDGLAFDPSGERLYVSDVVGGGVAVLETDTLASIEVLEAGTATGAILVR